MFLYQVIFQQSEAIGQHLTRDTRIAKQLRERGKRAESGGLSVVSGPLSVPASARRLHGFTE
jgi:hypothetical protein